MAGRTDGAGDGDDDGSFLATLAVESGQRKYGPPAGWRGEPPGKGCEIFLAKLPRDMADPELWRLVRRPGGVYELRVMTEPAGRNRGYAFVLYADRDTAKRAIGQLHNASVGEQRIGATVSVDNRRLFVGGLPRDRSKPDVLAELSRLLPDIVDVIMYPSAHDKSKNRGFAFVELPSHRAAALARQRLTRDRVALFGQAICVDWAEPELDVDDDTMKQVRIVYLRNLMLSTSEDTLWRLFDGYAPGAVERVKKIKDFAFVHFRTREAAETALEQAQSASVTIDGCHPEVLWARPPDRTFMRHVRDTMRSASSAKQMAGLPPAANVHQSIVLAAAAQAAAHGVGAGAGGFGGEAPAASAAGTVADMLARSPLRGTLEAEAEAALLWAYCGVPLIELPDDAEPPAHTGIRSVAGNKRSACRSGREAGSGQRKRAIAALSYYGSAMPTLVQPMVAGQGALPVSVATALFTPYQLANLVPSLTFTPAPQPAGVLPPRFAALPPVPAYYQPQAPHLFGQHHHVVAGALPLPVPQPQQPHAVAHSHSE